MTQYIFRYGQITYYTYDTAIYFEHNIWEALKQTLQVGFKNIKKSFDFKMQTINFENVHYVPKLK